MADAPLTSLCAICYSVPKYKCPRCGIQTCSMSCIKKHKAWSTCSGQRDATAYMPPSKLRTAAGIDHDYNFIHGIEFSLERSEKLLVEEKGLVQKEELRPLMVQDVQFRADRNGRKRKVLVTRVLRDPKARTFSKGLAHKLSVSSVQMICAPSGMSRQKENKTTVNGRTGRINWQVEWLLHDQEGEKEISRVLSKAMDDTPIFAAYVAALEEKERTQSVQPRKQTRQALRLRTAQLGSDPRWNIVVDCVQDPMSGTWVSFTGGQLDEWPAAKDGLQRKKYRYFLANPGKQHGEATYFTAIQPDDCLREILHNTRVFEFPTIHVVKSGCALPKQLVRGIDCLGDKSNRKRKVHFEAGQGEEPAPMKRRKGGEDLEEGEVSSDSEEAEDAEIIAEHSLDEGDDDDQDLDDDDDTSSSGSDSDVVLR